MCSDESFTSARAAAAAITLGSCSIVNVKPGRVGGYLLVDGHLRVPTAPGIGVHPLPDQLAAVTKSVEVLAL